MAQAVTFFSARHPGFYMVDVSARNMRRFSGWTSEWPSSARTCLRALPDWRAPYHLRMPPGIGALFRQTDRRKKDKMYRWVYWTFHIDIVYVCADTLYRLLYRKGYIVEIRNNLKLLLVVHLYPSLDYKYNQMIFDIGHSLSLHTPKNEGKDKKSNHAI